MHERANHHRSSPHHDHKPNDHTDKLIQLINTSNLGWKADPCKLQTRHEMYPSICKKDQKISLAQTKSDTEEGDVFGRG